MPTIVEGQLTFNFPCGWQAWKYDDLSFYRNQFQKVCGSKAVDIVALDPNSCTWLIEVKDYRSHRRMKAINIADEVARKARDTLAGLAAARFNANDPTEKLQADQAFKTKQLRIVLHLEQPQIQSKLFPTVIDPADVVQKMRQKMKAIDPHPKVVDLNTSGGLGWIVQ